MMSIPMKGYMCAVDHQWELGQASGSCPVYYTLEDCQIGSPCVKQCGVVEVELEILPFEEKYESGCGFLYTNSTPFKIDPSHKDIKYVNLWTGLKDLRSFYSSLDNTGIIKIRAKHVRWAQDENFDGSATHVGND